MAIQFDSLNRRIVLDTTTVTATEIYSRWVDWISIGDNSKYLPAFRSVGGDDLGGGISIPSYYFLQNGWYVRPMEATHTLTITGNLFVDGGGDPVVPTIGNFNVLIRSIVPVQAQTVSVGGIGTVSEVRDAIWSVPINTMTDKTTIGGYISKVLLSIPKFIGLK